MRRALLALLACGVVLAAGALGGALVSAEERRGGYTRAEAETQVRVENEADERCDEDDPGRVTCRPAGAAWRCTTLSRMEAPPRRPSPRPSTIGRGSP